jgi:hypothetical protein
MIFNSLEHLIQPLANLIRAQRCSGPGSPRAASIIPEFNLSAVPHRGRGRN